MALSANTGGGVTPGRRCPQIYQTHIFWPPPPGKKSIIRACLAYFDSIPVLAAGIELFTRNLYEDGLKVDFNPSAVKERPVKLE